MSTSTVLRGYVMTIPNKPGKFFANEETMNEAIVEAARGEGFYGKVKVEEVTLYAYDGKLSLTAPPAPTPWRDTLRGEPKADYSAYIIDSDGDRWDYFPSVNKFKMRRVRYDVTRGYNIIGFKSAAQVIATYGIRQSESTF